MKLNVKGKVHEVSAPPDMPLLRVLRDLLGLTGTGWDPGVGRAPVPVPHAGFVAKFKTWIDAGTPCPTP